MAKKKAKTIPKPPTGLGAAALSPLAPGPVKGINPDSLPLPAPPPGTYDPIIDYNAGAANRGFTQTQNDAQTLFDQGQEDYGLGLGDLTRGRDRTLADVATGQRRLDEDRYYATDNLGRQYGILGRQQAEGAAQRGVTSAGLLGKSAQVRGANQAREQTQIDLAHNRQFTDLQTTANRTGEDFNRNKLGLDLGNARQFGGFNGAIINNPLTGTPYTGSLATGVQRAFTENDAYQTALGQQRIGQAQQNGFISPLLLSPNPGGGISTPKPGDPGYEEYLARARKFKPTTSAY